MTAKVISLPFSFNSSGAVSYTESEEKIWQDRVVSVVMTNLTERVMRPTFGSDVKKATFENFDDASVLIEQTISAAFTTWLPSLTIDRISTAPDQKDGSMYITILYKYNKYLNSSVTIKTAFLNRAGDIILEVTNGR